MFVAIHRNMAIRKINGRLRGKPKGYFKFIGVTFLYVPMYFKLKNIISSA